MDLEDVDVCDATPDESDEVFAAVDRIDGEFRIVTDPIKVEEIKNEEVFRKRRAAMLYQELYREPWFTTKTSTLVSETIAKMGSIDGFFLVRSSSYRCSEYPDLDTFALTFIYKEKLVLFRILQRKMFNKPVFTIDNGVTKFPSIRSLIEFYQFNQGPLPCLLTDYPLQ